MRIACPSCQAVYDVPDALLTPSDTRAPAKLRCARCGAEWAPDRADAAAQAPPEASIPRPAGPTPSPFADALAHAMPVHPAAPPAVPPASSAPASPPVDDTAPIPLRIEPRPLPTAGEKLVAEHLAPSRFTPRPPRPQRSPRDSATLLFAWCLSLGVVAAVLIAAYLHRGDVIAFWPPAARAYGLLGLN